MDDNYGHGVFLGMKLRSGEVIVGTEQGSCYGEVHQAESGGGSGTQKPQGIFKAHHNNRPRGRVAVTFRQKHEAGPRQKIETGVTGRRRHARRGWRMENDKPGR